tara:strand:+ start:108 stop:314 length:207 start_codon:yes stop_codon:yes gene_type:complete
LDTACNQKVEAIKAQTVGLAQQLAIGEMYQVTTMFDDINVKCQRTNNAGGGATLACPAGNVEVVQGSF